jgi:hypothetical protein
LGLCSEKEAEKILDTAWANKIRAFDTAVSYGESVRRLANWLHTRSRIEKCHLVTKIPPESCESLSEIKKAIEPFEGAYSITVLSHGILTGNNWENYNRMCCTLGVIAGQSVYSAEEVRFCGKMGVKHLQAPGNVLDLEQIRAADDSKCTLDIRSVFLQGTLLANPVNAERRVPGLKKICELIGRIADSNGVSKVSLLINTLASFIKPSMRLVIGADSASEIAEWFSNPDDGKGLGTELIRQIRLEFGHLISRSMIDPRLWN